MNHNGKPGRLSRYVAAALSLGGPILGIAAAEFDSSKLPPPAARAVDYNNDIKPIFERSCFRCHGPERPKSHFCLVQRDTALRGGAVNTDDIIPLNSARSMLICYVAGLDEEKVMPPPGKGDPLTAEEIGLIRKWIDQGAPWPAAVRETSVSVTPMASWVTVDGNRRKFREDTWQKEGFTAGYERFEMRQPVGKDGTLDVEGRALFDQKDYRVALTLVRPDLGFVRGGYETYRKYFNDVGGYYAPFNLPPPALDREPSLDVGKAWFEAGLTLPDWPKLTVGYEYQFKDGDKSTLQWGQVSNDPGAFFGKAIYPGYKALDEHAHVIKLDVSHEIGGYALEDNFRTEFYDLSTTRVNRGDFTPDAVALHKESYSHIQAANSFRAEKQLNAWLFLSGGYLYSHLEGDGSFNQAFSSLSGAFPAYTGDSTDRLSLRQHSHTVNLNTLLGPWDGFSLAAALQSDWTRREGLTDLVIGGPGGAPGEQASNLDRTTLDESVGLRYTAIPFTVFYAESRFQQEWDDHFEREFIDDGFPDNRDFSRDTDARSDLKEYRVGFTVSPWPRVSFEPGYKHREKQSDYDHRVDEDLSQDPFISGNGYPAFIRARNVTTDQVEAKLVLRPATWLKTTLKYQLVAADYRTTTDPAYLISFPTNIFFPGGEILAGNQDAHVYSANLTLTPWRRLYLSTTVSYTKSRVLSGVNNGAAVVPYRGDLYSVLSSGTLVLSASTDLIATYSFSRADYRQHNEADGLPLGIFYDRHAVTAGISRRLLKNMTARLQYGFFYYNEPSAGGANNYRAHAVLASLNVSLP
jgi:mono/diheme cytochrome c family protein